MVGKTDVERKNLGTGWNFNHLRESSETFRRFLISANISISSHLVKKMLLPSCVWVILGAASQDKTVAESLRWKKKVIVGGGGGSTRCQKPEWKISTILHGRIHPDRPHYLSTVA